MINAPQSQRTSQAGVHLAGFAFEKLGLAFRAQLESDYGIDAHVELMDGNSPTGRLLGVQIKAGSSFFSEKDGANYVFRADSDHVDYWLNHSLPVVVCLCDTERNLVFWQTIAEDTAIPTRINYKFLVPEWHVLSPDFLPVMKAHFTTTIAHDKYTIAKTRETSHAGAKRYSFHAVLNRSFTKREVATIVRQLTFDGAKRRYYRNHLTERRWGDTDAHVIWTFIYPSFQDLANNNLICRSLWINPSLEEQWRPSTFDGENVGDGIIVDWNSQYDIVAGLFSSHQSTKEEYLNQILPLCQQLETRLTKLSEQLHRLSSDAISEAEFLLMTQVDRKNVARIYREISDLPTAPYECAEVDKLLQNAAGSADNISIWYAESKSSNWTEESRLAQAWDQCQAAKKELQDLEYELDKIR